MAQNPVDSLQAAQTGIRRVVLDNGLVVLLKQDRSAPLVAIQYWVNAGAIHEGAQLGGGLSHYLEHMVFKGTAKRGPGQVSKEIADIGGEINAYTSNDRTVFHVVLPATHWLVGLDVLTDAVFHPSFPAEEWEREREVILREVDMGEDDPMRVFSRLVNETAFRVHPYRVPVIGWRDILITMNRDHLVAYHQRHYSPDNMILAIVGDVALDDMEAAVREQMREIPRTPREPVLIPAEPPQLAEQYGRKTGPYNVTRVGWVFHGTDLANADAPALDVLASVIGSGRASILVKKFREEEQLVLDIEAWNYTPKEPGLFGITFECEPAQEAAALAALRAEVASWHSTLMDPARIEQARREVLAGAIQTLTTMEGQAQSFASGEFYTGDPRFNETYLNLVQQVTPADLQRVVQKYLRPENGSLAILAPASEEPTTQAPATSKDAAIQLHTLANGMRLLVREDPRLPMAYVSVVIGGGVLGEQAGQAGISQLTAELLLRGTSQLSAAELASKLESRAVSLSAYSGRNTYGLNAAGLSEDLPLMLNTVAECLIDSQFPADEIEKQRAFQLADIQRSLEKPMTHAQQMVRDAFFPGHPYQYSSLGNTESVSALTRDDIVAHHRRLLVGSNVVVAVFGNINAAEVVAQVETGFAPLPPGVAPTWPKLPDTVTEPAQLEKGLPFKQTVIVRAWRGIAAGDPREDALSVLADTLSGLSSDLFIEVRDKRGLAYYTGASQLTGPVGGLFMIYSGTTTEGRTEVCRQIQVQTDRLSQSGPRPEEFARAVEQMVAGQARSLQNNSGLAQQCAIDELLGLGWQHSFQMIERLRQLQPEDVRAIAQTIFGNAGDVTVVVLPADIP